MSKTNRGGSVRHHSIIEYNRRISFQKLILLNSVSDSELKHAFTISARVTIE